MHKIIIKAQSGVQVPYIPQNLNGYLDNSLMTRNVQTSSGGGAAVGGFKNWASKNQNVMNLVSSGVNTITGAISDAFGEQEIGEDTKAARETTRGALNSIPMVGPLISTATGFVDMAGDLTGTNLDDINMDSAKKAGVGAGATFNKIMNALPGNSMLWGIWGGDTNSVNEASQIAMNTMGGYGTAMDKYNVAKDLSKKRMLIGRKKANKRIDEANELLAQMDEIGTDTELRNQNDYAQALKSQNMRRLAGNQMMAAVGKKGTKLPSLKKIKKVEKVRQQIHDKYIEQLSSLSFPEPDLEIALRQIESNIDKFKEGGKFNMLAKGTYHCRNHHLEVKDSRFAEVTKKGIPVVVEDKNGNIIQTAEIEQNELIFNKEITDKIEALRKDGSDEAAIECGKLLVTQCTRHLRNKPKEDK